MSDRDDKRALEALEAELRQDRLEEPPDAFFTDLKQQVMQKAAGKPVPRRPWWRGAELMRWLWRPAPVAALAGAAAVALVVLWVGGPGGGEEISAVSPQTLGGGDRAPVAKASAPDGEAWFAQLPPAEDLWAVEDKDLPALLAVLSAEEPGDDDELFEPAPGDPVGEPSLGRLTEDQLRTLERMLDRQKTKKQKPARPRPAMRKAG